MLIGAEVALEIPAPVGVAEAARVKDPRLEGFQLQVTEWLEPDPEVDLFLQPGSTFPLIVNVIFEATETFAVIRTADL